METCLLYKAHSLCAGMGRRHLTALGKHVKVVG